jgi:hypothetical protein
VGKGHIPSAEMNLAIAADGYAIRWDTLAPGSSLLLLMLGLYLSNSFRLRSKCDSMRSFLAASASRQFSDSVLLPG